MPDQETGFGPWWIGVKINPFLDTTYGDSIHSKGTKKVVLPIKLSQKTPRMYQTLMKSFHNVAPQTLGRIVIFARVPESMELSKKQGLRGN